MILIVIVMSRLVVVVVSFVNRCCMCGLFCVFVYSMLSVMMISVGLVINLRMLVNVLVML